MTSLTGVGSLTRLILKRDRIRIAIWVVGIVGLVAGAASGIGGAYPTDADLEQAANAIEGNASQIALNGPAQGLDTLGGRVAFEVWNFGLVAVALMSLLMVGRHTRAEEESGRHELVRAAVIGRHAQAAAAYLVVAGMNLLVATGVALALGIQGLPIIGSWTLGASFAAAGLVFASAAMIVSQITANARAVTGITGMVVGLAFLLRAIGDAGGGNLSLFSPMGWAQASRPFAGERRWPLLVTVATAAGLFLAAAALAAKRDVGAGLLRPGPGRPTASSGLARPIGLALRLQRRSLIGWSTGLFLAGLAFGSIGQSVEDLLGDNPNIQDVFAQSGGASLTDSFFATSLLILALIAAGNAIQSAQSVRSEETLLRAEPILATAVSRWRFAGSHLAVTLTGSAIVLAAAGSGTGVAYAAISGEPVQTLRLLGSAFAYLPAVWVLTGFSAALFGLAPRLVTLAWVGLAISAVVGLFGQLLDLPGWFRDLSPFQHTPQLPAAELSLGPLAILVAVAAGLIATGLVGFRWRDLDSRS